MTHYALHHYLVKSSAVVRFIMSSQMKFKSHNRPNDNIGSSRVHLTELLTRLQEEKKRERNSNIALLVAAVSAVTVFGIILSL